MLRVVHRHMRQQRRLSLAQVLTSPLEVEGKLVLVRHVRERMSWVGSGKGLALQMFLVAQMHGGVRLLVVLKLPPGRQSIK